MFKIYQPSFVTAYEAYETLENVLIQEKEVSTDTTVVGWKGVSAESYKNMKATFSEETYSKALNQLKGMREMCEYSLPVINSLMKRCEELGNQIKQDSPYEFYKPADGDNTVYNNGYLAFSRGYSKAADNACESAMALAVRERDILNAIMDDCGGLVSFGNAQENVNSAYRKIARIENLRESFDKYVSEFETLETDMKEMLAQRIDYTQLEWLTLYESKLGTAEQLTREEALIESCHQKGADKVTEKDIELMCELYIEAFENKDTEMLTKIYQSMTCNESGNTTSSTCVPDKDMILRLMDKMDPQLQGEAYYTLNRIANYECWSEKTEKTNYSLRATITEEGKIQVIVETKKNANDKKPKIHYITACDMGEIITAEREKELIKQGFTEDDIRVMCMNILTDEDIVLMQRFINGDYYETFRTSTDNISNSAIVGMAYFLMRLDELGNQDEIYTIANSALQTDTQYCHRVNNTQEWYMEKLQNSFAGIIGELNQSIADSYAAAAKDGQSTALVYSESEMERLIANGNSAYAQNAFWTVVNELYGGCIGQDARHGFHHGVVDGLVQIQLTDRGQLGITDSKSNLYHFDAVLSYKDSVTGEVDEETFTMYLTKVTGEDYAGAITQGKIDELEEERQMNKYKSVIDFTAAILCLEMPLAGVGATAINELIIDQSSMDGSSFVDSATSIPFEELTDNESLSDKLSCFSKTSELVGKVVSPILQYMEMGEKIEEEKLELYNRTLGQAVNYEVMYDNEEIYDGLRSEGIVLPATYKNVYEFQQKGINAYLDDVRIKGADGQYAELSDYGKDDLVQALLKENNEEELVKFINGNGKAITDLTGDDIDDYSRFINKRIGNKTESDFREWLRGE